MMWHPRGYGGQRRDPDQVKRDGWTEQGVLAVAIDDRRLTWPERELIRQLGCQSASNIEQVIAFNIDQFGR